MSAKVERLLNLTAVLLSTSRPLTAIEIRERVPGYPEGAAAAHRQFERDKDDLRERGIPLVVEEVPGADPPVLGYRIPRDKYYLADPGLDPDELAAIHLAVSAVRLDGVEGLAALWHLGDGPAEVPGRPPVAALPSDPNLAPLFAAATERRTATFAYRGRERTVDPYRIDFSQGHWYLSAREHGREADAALRVYRIDRVGGPVRTGPEGSVVRPAEPVPAPVLGGWRLGEGPPVEAFVLVDADQAPWVIHHLGEAAVVERHDDGSVVVRLEVTNRDGFRSFVLSLLDHAEVLAPAELRADLVAWLEAVAAGDADAGHPRR